MLRGPYILLHHRQSHASRNESHGKGSGAVRVKDKRAGKRHVEKGTTAGAHPAIARAGSHGCKKRIKGPKRGVS